MASDQVRVNVSFREIPLFEGAILQGVSATGGFLHTESPMPVGTMVILSPHRAPEVRVPATVSLVLEACRGARPPEAEQPGMTLAFQAGGEQLLDHLEDLSAAVAAPVATPVVASPTPTPILPIIPPPRPVEPPSPSNIFEEVPTKVERRVVIAAPVEETSSGLQPVASGSLTVEAAPPPAVSDEPSVIVSDLQHHEADPDKADPDGPDKVILEMEPVPRPSDEGEDENEGGDGGDGEESEGDSDDAKKKKKKRARRRKKR